MTHANKRTILYLRVDHGGQHVTVGGSVAHTVGVIKGFISNGWSVVCVSSSLIDILHATFKQIPVYTVCMPFFFKPLRWKLNCLLSNIWFTTRIIRICMQHADITHVYQRHSPFCIIGVLVAQWLTVPLILEYNGSEVWMARHWCAPSLFSLQWLLRLCEQISLRAATHIVVVSQESVAQVHQIAPHAHIIVQPNGVDTQEFDPIQLVDERIRIRNQYAVDNRFVFGFIGTFSPWHGINQLAAMIPTISAREPRAAFVLIGEGQLKAWLHDQLVCEVQSGRVIFTGKVPQQMGKHYLAACDAFLLPTQPNADGSPFFGSPIKLFEYMSMAKPIIASDIAQVSSVLAGLGILVHPTDTDGFVAAACSLVQSETHELQARGTAARAYVMTQYTWHAHVKTIIATIDGASERVA